MRTASAKFCENIYEFAEKLVHKQTEYLLL